MFQIKNIATHNFQNGNTTLDVAAQTVCEFKHLFEIYLQSFMFQIKRDQKYCDTQLSKWKHLDCSITNQLHKVLRQLALDATRGGACPQKIRETRA